VTEHPRAKQHADADESSLLTTLTPNPRSARADSERNLEFIAPFLQQVGAAHSIVVDEDGVILAGNATISAHCTHIDRISNIAATRADLVRVFTLHALLLSGARARR
jgi:hypothetical protein